MKKYKNTDIFMASNMPFPFWWDRDDIVFYGADIKKADEYLEKMNVVQFARIGRDFIPLYKDQDSLRIWDFKFIAKL